MKGLLKSRQDPSFMPVEVASAAGAIRSGWLRNGSGPWSGWVVRKRDEAELAVEEVANGWQVTDAEGKNVGTGHDLITVLKKVLK